MLKLPPRHLGKIIQRKHVNNITKLKNQIQMYDRVLLIIYTLKMNYCIYKQNLLHFKPEKEECATSL